MINSMNTSDLRTLQSKDNALIEKMRRKSVSNETVHSSFSEVLESKNHDRPVDRKLMDTCVEMESILVGKMLKEMRSTLHKEESLLYGGMAEDIFEDMLYDEYALSMSKNSSLGLARMLYNQLS